MRFFLYILKFCCNFAPKIGVNNDEYLIKKRKRSSNGGAEIL